MGTSTNHAWGRKKEGILGYGVHYDGWGAGRGSGGGYGCFPSIDGYNLYIFQYEKVTSYEK